MRRIVITGLIVFSTLTLSWVGGAFGQRVREGAAATTRATQVEVTNFPSVQGVTGAVNVGNLPAVQTVGGSVAISNLPLDADGNLRVIPTPQTPSFSLRKIADGLAIDAPKGSNIPIGTFSVGGYHRFVLIGRTTINPENSVWCFRLQPLLTIDGSQIGAESQIDFCSSSSGTTITGVSYSSDANMIWPELTIVAMPYSPTDQAVGTATLDLWLYLSN